MWGVASDLLIHQHCEREALLAHLLRLARVHETPHHWRRRAGNAAQHTPGCVTNCLFDTKVVFKITETESVRSEAHLADSARVGEAVRDGRLGAGNSGGPRDEVRGEK
jgi:hypothetical protein